jgi:LacI family transcriptional regulator
LQQVAEVAQVHVSTVSRALDPSKASLVSEATRAKVIEVAEQLGYRPHLIASQLRRGQTQTVGVVVPDLGNPLYAPFVRGVTHVLDDEGYVPLVADTQDDHERFRRTLRHLWNRRVDAIITTAARLQDRDAACEIADAGTPVVVAVRTLPGSGLPSVDHDDVAGGRLAAEHLLELGHRRLVQLRGPLDVTPFLHRARGFTAAVTGAGLAETAFDVTATHPTVAEGRRVMRALLAASDGDVPTGIFAHNDLLALGALEALRHADLWCPRDVSLVGYNDNFYAAHARPSMTAVRLPGYEMGQLAAAMAMDHIRDPDGAATSVTTEPVLLVRESTGPPPRR